MPWATCIMSRGNTREGAFGVIPSIASTISTASLALATAPSSPQSDYRRNRAQHRCTDPEAARAALAASSYAGKMPTLTLSVGGYAGDTDEWANALIKMCV
jgi:hypothetical protein